MTIFKGILMGLIQGLTEFLPVSSSGHLAIFKLIFKADTDTGLLFDVLLHVATLVSIFVAFFHDVTMLIKEGFGILGDWLKNLGIFFRNLKAKDGKKAYKKVVTGSYRRFVMLIIIATIPTGIIGIAGKDFVESAQESLLVPGICLILTAIVLFIADRCKGGEKLPSDTEYLDAFKTGMAQGVATLPGLSRSGSTITACLLCGFERKYAVKFSFLMSIPAILGAAILELKDIGEARLLPGEIPAYICGMIVAAVVGFVCIKTMLVIVRKQKFTVFSVYCLAAGILSLIGYFSMR